MVCESTVKTQHIDNVQKRSSPGPYEASLASVYFSGEKREKKRREKKKREKEERKRREKKGRRRQNGFKFTKST
jgi:hypothetical protein